MITTYFHAIFCLSILVSKLKNFESPSAELTKLILQNKILKTCRLISEKYPQLITCSQNIVTNFLLSSQKSFNLLLYN
jgi:hypothetical protein